MMVTTLVSGPKFRNINPCLCLLSLKAKMTDDEKLKLYEDLVRARRSLSETRLLHRPIQDKDSSFFKNTLRRYTFTFNFVGAGVDALQDYFTQSACTSEKPDPEIKNLFSMLNSAEHEIYPAHKC